MLSVKKGALIMLNWPKLQIIRITKQKHVSNSLAEVDLTVYDGRKQ